MKRARLFSTKTCQHRFKPCSSHFFLESDREESNHKFSHNTENPSDCGIKHLSHYREEYDLRMLVGKVHIKPLGITRTFRTRHWSEVF